MHCTRRPNIKWRIISGEVSGIVLFQLHPPVNCGFVFLQRKILFVVLHNTFWSCKPTFIQCYWQISMCMGGRVSVCYRLPFVGYATLRTHVQHCATVCSPHLWYVCVLTDGALSGCHIEISNAIIHIMPPFDLPDQIRSAAVQLLSCRFVCKCVLVDNNMVHLAMSLVINLSAVPQGSANILLHSLIIRKTF